MKGLSTYLGLLALLAVSGLLPLRSAAAAVPYPTPHRAWVKVGAVAYQSSLSSTQLDWAASHMDWLDNPHSEFIAGYAAKTDAKKLLYEEFYSTYLSDYKWSVMQSWAASHGVNPETMLLHYSQPTTVTNGGSTYTLQAGDHVLCFWGSSGTDRVVCNPRSANYQAFSTYWAQTQMSASYGGVTYDGFFVDDAFPGVLNQQTGTITSGGAIAEYPEGGDVSASFDKDMVSIYAASRQGMGPKGAAGSKQLWLNSASYIPDNLDAAYPYIDGLFREYVIYPSSMYAGRMDRLLQASATATAAGVGSVIGAYGLGSTATDSPTNKIYALAMYYIAAGPLDYFCRQDSNSGDLSTYAWIPALDFDIGSPQGAAYQLSSGVYARPFSKALVIANLSGSSKSVSLPATSDNPSGAYYQVDVTGAKSSSGITSLSLGAASGAILAKATSGGVAPTASFTANPTTGTAPLTVLFSDTSTGSPTSWAWSFGDGGTSTSQSPSHTYAAAGAYTASLTVTNSLGSSTATKSITVNAPPAAPTASFTASPTTGVAPLAVQFTDTSTGSPTGWSWNFGDGGTSTAQNPSHTYSAAGAYTASLTASNSGGSNTATKSISVTAPAPAAPVANFSASPTSGTAPLTVQFTDTSTGSPTAWAWTFGDGGTSSAQSPSHQYTAAGTYTAALKATNSLGSSTATKTITVSTAPATTPLPKIISVALSQNSITLGQTATITVAVANTGTNAGISGVTVSLPALTSSGDTTYVTQVPTGWGSYAAYGPGATIWTRSNTKIAAKYVMTETSASSWGSGTSRVFTLQVKPKTTGAFTFDVRAWMLPTSGSTTYIDPGTSTASDQQGYPVAQTSVTVNVVSTAPTASFTASPTTGAAPLAVQFTDTSTGAPTAWAWTFGDGGASTAQSPSHAYSAAGTYMASLTASNAYGSTSATRTITVSAPVAPPVASFTASPTTGVAPLAVQFTDTSTGSPTAWSWSFGDGTTSTVQNPSHTYAAGGTYTVSLTAKNAGGSTTATQSGYIVVGAAPVAATTPLPKITSVALSQNSITLGQTATITVTVANTGTGAGASGVSVSLPALTSSGDTTYVTQVPTGWGLYAEYGAGSTIWTRSGTRMTAKYLLAETYASNWGSGTSRTFSIQVKPKTTGTFTFYVRAWMLPTSGSTVYIDPGTSTVSDQQGWPVAVSTVTVN